MLLETFVSSENKKHCAYVVAAACSIQEDVRFHGIPSHSHKLCLCACFRCVTFYNAAYLYHSAKIILCSDAPMLFAGQYFKHFK